MGPQSNEEYALYCNGQPVNGIQDFGFEPQNKPDPLDAFLHMEPLELAFTIFRRKAPGFSHGDISRRSKP